MERKMDKKKIALLRKSQRSFVLKALTDPKFRRALIKTPAQALGKKQLSKVEAQEVELVLAAVKGIETQINTMADKLLCNNGGTCGIA